MNAFEPPVDPLHSAFGASPAMAMLAHDLRGCLQGILGGVILLEEATVAADVRAQIDRIGAASRTLDRLLGAMIGEEPERAGLAPSGSVDIPNFVDYLRRRWIGEALERGLAFTLSPGRDLPRSLRVERVALVRVLGNLIGNALQYTAGSSAGHAVHVCVERPEDGGIAFRVADDGPGMDVAALEASLRRGPGVAGGRAAVHGLGLHIVRDLTARMGGSLVLESPASGGCAATLRFPATLCRAVAAVGASTGRPDLGGLRVLLAEDNPTNQMVAVQMLRALNARVAVASDGVEALEAFEKDAFDLLVVDIEMPRLSGLDVIRRVRGRGDARAEVPIVALTAYALREHREQIAEAGASGLISKPITSIDALGRALLAHVASPAAPAARRDAAAPQAEAAPPVIDQAIYEALCQSIGSEMMAELLGKVLSDLRANRAALVAARRTLDRGQIRSASHILISVSGAIGAGRLQACAQSLNILAHRDGDAALEGELAACFDEIDAALAFTERQRAAG